MHSLTFDIEHHPENGALPFIVVIRDGKEMNVWCAYPTLEVAEEKQRQMQNERFNGLFAT